MSWPTTLKDRDQPRRTLPLFTLQVLFTPEGGVPSTDVDPRPLRAGETLIGRAADTVDIALPDDPRVSREHARVRVEPAAERVTLSNCSSTETTVNGLPVDAAVLANGDVIRAGDCFLLFRRELSRSDAGGAEPETDDFGLLGRAPSMRLVRQTLRLAGRSSTTVLLLGETGTGKELAARAVHQASGRTGPFVAVNCSAIAESLAEAQLFGHKAGSYTGAKADAPGFFQAASGGTLFLDEVGELSPTLQPKLLRVLEERAVTPVGSTQPVACDLRLVAATNRDLVQAIDGQRFRGDLYARLAEFVIEMPPLRARREDLLTLWLQLLGSPAPALDPELVQALLIHSWPFNVRELRTLATQWRARWSDNARAELDHFAGYFAAATASAGNQQCTDQESQVPSAPAEQGASDLAPAPDREQLEQLLRQHKGILANIARATGRSRKQVYRWLENHGLAADDYRE